MVLETLFHWYEQFRAVSYWERGGVQRTDGLPLPPGGMLMQVAGSPAPDVYLHGGELAAESIRATLDAHGVPLLGSVLDFGCGCGRVLRRWHNQPVELHGCDYNAELVGWSREHLPFAKVAFNGLRPPAPYRDGHFDLIYALSVITHMPEPLQRPWMREFCRILRPGGHLLISTHGEHYRPHLTSFERRKFDAEQLVVRAAHCAGSNLCNAYHPTAYFRSNLIAGFDVIHHAPRGAKGNPEQDLWLLRKCDD